MISYLSNTLLGSGGNADHYFPPGVAELLTLVSQSRPVLETYVATKNSDYKELRKKAFSPEATVQTAKSHVSEIISQMKTVSIATASKPLLVYYGSHTPSPHWSKYAPDNFGGTAYQADGLGRELAVALWNYAALQFKEALSDSKIHLSAMIDAADLFEWHSNVAETWNIGSTNNSSILSIYANAKAGKMMKHICLALYSYETAQGLHKKFCNNPKITEYAFWFMKNGEEAYKATYLIEWLKAITAIYDHSRRWNVFFFWASYCVETSSSDNNNPTIEQVLRAMTKLVLTLENEKQLCAPAFRLTLTNTRELSKISASWSWAFWSSDPGSISYASLPVQKPDMFASLTRRENVIKMV